LFLGEGTVGGGVCSFGRFFSGHPWASVMPRWGMEALLSGHQKELIYNKEFCIIYIS